MRPSKFTKLLSMILCFIMLLSILAGCNINEELTKASTETSAEETTTEKSDDVESESDETTAEETTTEEAATEETTMEETTTKENTMEETTEPATSLPEANVIIWSGGSNAYGESPITDVIRSEGEKRNLLNVYISCLNINKSDIDQKWMTAHKSDGFVPFELGNERDGENNFSAIFGMVCYLIDNGYVTEEKPLYIIKFAAAQTVLNSQWFSSTSGRTADTGNLVDTLGTHLSFLMRDFISESLKEIETTHTPKIQSFVWLQGEADACYSYVTNGYAGAESSLVRGIRKSFEAYAGDNGITFIDLEVTERAANGRFWWQYAANINREKKENAQYYFDVDSSFDESGKLKFNYTENTEFRINNSILISADDFLLTKSEVGESEKDGANFASESAYMLGRIMGRSMLELHGSSALDDDIKTDIKEPEELPEANVILWSGQSNAYGSCPITAEMRAEYAKRDFSNVYIHYSNINLRNSTDWEEFFGNDGFEQFTLGDEADGPNFFSPLFGTVCYLLDNGYITEDKPLYIIKYTAAQTVLNSQWFPSNVSTTADHGGLIEDMGGHLSTLMEDFVSASLKEIKKTHTPKIHAFVWIQGESDGQNETVSKGYAKAEQELMSYVREKYGEYAGDNGIVFINYAIKERETNKLWWRYADNVNTAKEENAQYYFNVDTSFEADGTLSLNYSENTAPGIDNSVLIAVEDFVLTKAEVGESATDGAHFSSKSGYQLGRIIGRVYSNALGETTEDDPAVSGICPVLNAPVSEHYKSDADGHWIDADCNLCGIRKSEKTAHNMTEGTASGENAYNEDGHLAVGICNTCGLTVTSSVAHNMTVEDTTEGENTVHTFKCTDCGFSAQKTFPSSDKHFSSLDLFSFPAVVSSNYQIKESINGTYYRLTGSGQYGSEIFIRSALDSSAVNPDYCPINIGNAKFVVIKIRSNAATASYVPPVK